MFKNSAIYFTVSTLALAAFTVVPASAATCGTSSGTDLAANVANINAGPCVKLAVAAETINAPIFAFVSDPITGRDFTNSGNNSSGGEGGSSNGVK